jgi:hypothetical protein
LHGGDYAREEFELKDERKALAAEGGKSYAFVLDFECLSRSAPPCKQCRNPLSVIHPTCRATPREILICLMGMGTAREPMRVDR